MRKLGSFWQNQAHELRKILEQRSLTKQESRDLGRAEYWNPENKGQSVAQVFGQFVYDGGRVDLWKHEFINGWYGATMVDDDEPHIVPGDLD